MNAKQIHARRQVACEAAKLMVENGIRDYQLAKRKAAGRLGVGNSRDLPRNDEIEREREAYQRLFGDDEHAQHVVALRRRALEAMRLLERFDPRLVGPVLNGTADWHSEICLHLFSDPPEAVAMFLLDRRIAFDQGEARIRFQANTHERLPAFVLTAGEAPVELVVFSARARRRAPLSPVDGRPMRRAKLAEVTALVEAPA